MSLISLLIALAAERYLSSPVWQFTSYYQHYLKLIAQYRLFDSVRQSSFIGIVMVLVPVVLCSLLLNLIEDGLLHLIISTLVLIVCFGCIRTRDCYKNYLMAAFRGDQTSCELHHEQLQQDKNLVSMSFGQMLVWLNYRYFIAVMIFFVVFGAPGALFYRLLVTVNENPLLRTTDPESDEEKESASKFGNSAESNAENTVESNVESNAESAEVLISDVDNTAEHASALEFNKKVLFWVDWLPVRMVAFGYMLVGHFSKAMPMWLEMLFDVYKAPSELLNAVAQKAEDFMVDVDDCTAEPCILVRLAKRTLLLCLAVIALLILTGILN